MIQSAALSPSQKEIGQKNYCRFSFFNGLSYISVGETILTLFAIKLGCSDQFVAVLGSMLFLSYFTMPVGKWLIAKVGSVKGMVYCWRIRNAAVLIIAVSPLFFFNLITLMQWIVLSGAFVFYSCRAIGIPCLQQMLGEITDIENRGKFTARYNGIFYMSNIIMLASIIALMSYSKELWVFIATISVGALLGMISTLFLGHIDESEITRISARKPIFQDVIHILGDSDKIRQLAANCVSSSAITLTIPISMLALKRGYGINDNVALYFAAAQMGGALLISYVLRLLAQETGPRPLAILAYSISMILSLLWFFAPASFNPIYMIPLFMFAGSIVCGTSITMTHYFLLAIPENQRVVSSITMNVASGIFAGIAGSVLGGGILYLLNKFSLAPLSLFKIYFLIIFFILLAGLFIMLRLKPLADWKVRDVLSLAFTPKDLMTLFYIYNIKPDAPPSEERENIDRLLEVKSELSEKALISYLDSPKFSLRIRAINALAEIPLSPEAEKAILHELEFGEYGTANIAAQIAGERGLNKAVPLLRKYLNASDVYLQCKAMLSLAQLHDTESYPALKELFRTAVNPRILTHGSAALFEISDDESFSILLEKSLMKNIPQMVHYEIIYSIMLFLGAGDSSYKFLKLYSKAPARAISTLKEKNTDQEIHSILDQLNDSNSLEKSKSAFREYILSIYKTRTGQRSSSITAFISGHPAGQIPTELFFCLLLT